MFSFQGTWWVSFSRDSMKYFLIKVLQSISFFEVVEISGIEPLTSWMPFKRSPSWAIPPYLPRKWWAKMDSLCCGKATPVETVHRTVSKSRLSSPRRFLIVQLLWSIHHGQWNWWAKMDSNHRPHDYQSCALASWAIGPSWWRLAGSNRWPPACKAGALPAELNPRNLSIFIIRYILFCTL